MQYFILIFSILVARIVNRQPTTGTAAQQIPIPFRLVQNQQQRAQAQQQQAQNPGFNPQAARQEPALEQQARARLNAKEQTGKKKMWKDYPYVLTFFPSPSSWVTLVHFTVPSLSLPFLFYLLLSFTDTKLLKQIISWPTHLLLWKIKSR